MNWFSEEEYSKILDNLVIVCVDTLIIDQADSILLGKRQKLPLKDLWIFGGRMNADENYIQAAQRGLLRELNLESSADRLKLVGYYDLVWSTREEPPQKNGTHVLLVAMMYRINDNEKSTIQSPKDHDFIRWYDRAKLDQIDLDPYLRTIVNDAYKQVD